MYKCYYGVRVIYINIFAYSDRVIGKQWLHLEDNSIIVSGYSKTYHSNNIKNVTYKIVTYGKHVILRNRTGISNAKRQKWKSPLLENMKGNFMVIVAKRDELEIENPHLLFIDGSSQVTME